MTEAYTAEATAQTVEVLTQEFGRSAKSVVAKLAQLGVYKAKARAKAEKTTLTKAARASALCQTLGVAEADREMVAAALATLTGKVLTALETSEMARP